MAAIAKSVVSVRFFGEDLEPEALTRALGCEPTTHYRKGDKRVSGGREYTRKYGAWVLAAEDREPEAVDEQLTALFGRMSQDMSVWKELVSRYDANVFCGMFMGESNEGFSLAPASLQALAARSLEVGFDVYAPSEDESSPDGASET